LQETYKIKTPKMMTDEVIFPVYLSKGLSVHPALPTSFPLKEDCRIYELRGWMVDVRRAAEELLHQHGLHVPAPHRHALLNDPESLMRSEADWYAGAKPLLTRILRPSLQNLQAEWLKLSRKVLVFVEHPELGIPYPVNIGNPEVEANSRSFPTDGEDYWQWIGFVEEQGEKMAKAAGIALPLEEPRHFPGHKFYHLWLAITFYEEIYSRATGTWVAPSLPIRDEEMARKLLAKALAEQEELEAALAAKKAEIAALKS